MSSSLMLGLKAGRLGRFDGLNGSQWFFTAFRLQVCRLQGVLDPLIAEEFLSWPLWYDKDGLADMAYTTCTMDLRIS